MTIRLMAVFLFIIVFIPLSAENFFTLEKALSLGSTIDVAPSGIEKKYLTVKTYLSATGITGLSVHPALSLGRCKISLMCPSNSQQFSLLTPPLGGWGAWLQ